MTDNNELVLGNYCPKCGAHMSERVVNGDVVDGRAVDIITEFFCVRCYEKRQLIADRPSQRDAARRRRESPRALAGVDVDRAVAHLRTVPVLAELLGKRRIEVSVGHRAEGGCGGRAWTFQTPADKDERVIALWPAHVATKYRRRQARARRYAGRIKVYSGPSATPARVLEVVLHELCHLAAPKCQHNERFRRVFQRAVREAWGIEVSIDVDRENHHNASYKMGEIVIAKLEEGAFDIGPYVSSDQRKVRQTSRAELVEKRASHALKMLKQSERRLKVAKTVHKRWAKKVSYYERVAAKRGNK